MSEAYAHQRVDPMLTSHLEGHLRGALEEFAAREQVLVALDFDGTLAPIVPNPDDARMTGPAADAILELSQMPGVTLALVSGRAALDLASVAELPDDTFVIGSHGSQIGRVRTNAHNQPELLTEDVDLTPDQETLLEEVHRRLEVIAGIAPGAWVETKPTTAVLHTRALNEDAADRLTREAAEGPGALEGTRTIIGKRVVEISVLDVHKGDGIALLRERSGAHATMYVGDDTTDEDAFAAMDHDGDLSVKVGEGSTHALYRVGNPEEVAYLLLELVRLRKQQPAH